MSFQKNKYTVLKGVVSPEVAKFVKEYFLLKERLLEPYLMKDIFLNLQLSLVYGMMSKFLILILIMQI
jgi:hypothetical protein